MTRPDTDWMTQAACRGTATAVFFPDVRPGMSNSQLQRAYATAKTYCAACPVARECLAFCLPFEKETGRRDGMYGGLTPQDRTRLGL